MWGAWKSGQLGGGRVDLAIPGKGDRGGRGVGGALQERIADPGLFVRASAEDSGNVFSVGNFSNQKDCMHAPL